MSYRDSRFSVNKWTNSCANWIFEWWKSALIGGLAALSTCHLSFHVLKCLLNFWEHEWCVMIPSDRKLAQSIYERELIHAFKKTGKQYRSGYLMLNEWNLTLLLCNSFSEKQLSKTRLTLDQYTYLNLTFSNHKI